MKQTIAIILLTTLLSCHHSDRTISFYYWRTNLNFDSTETATLAYNHVSTVYLRYFDVDQPPGKAFPQPVAPLSVHDTVHAPHFIPVIFIRNRVFEHIDSTGIDTLVENIRQYSKNIDTALRQDPDTIQFDCDWTEKTKTAWFRFLEKYRSATGKSVTCTIRLHQVKYPGRTGIPPVDKGILMCYNIGNIDAGNGNSIYTPATAARYFPSLPAYPLPLDIALPIFTWGLQIRNGKVIGLLNKMNFQHFENDTNFTRQSDGRFRVVTACFNGGYYFKTGDLVKIEHVDAHTLENIADDIRRYSNHRLHNIIFYDLDAANLRLYDKKDFKKILDRFD